MAGLSAAYHSGLAIYEQHTKPGGTADSISQKDYVFDLGIHVLHSNDPNFYQILDDVGAELITQKRRAWIYSHGGYSAYPFQVNTFYLPRSVRFRCVAGYLLRRNRSKPENYKEWLIQNFGRGFSQTFLIPYAEKFWRVSPSQMTYEWTSERVPQPRTIDVIKGAFRNQETTLGPNSEFHYPTKHGAGFAGIAQALASRINNIHYGMKAKAIDVHNRIITFNEGQEKITYDFLISTIPLPELVKLLSHMPSDVHSAADQLRFNSIAIVNLGVDLPNISNKHWIHYSEKDISFFRISFPNNFCKGLSPKGKSLIQAEVSYDLNNSPDRSELLRRVHSDLVRVGVLEPDHKISFEDVVYLKYGYVIYDHHRKAAVEKIHNYLHSLNIYTCGRYGDWEYHWSDDAIMSGKRAVEIALQKHKTKSKDNSGQLVT